MNKKICLLLLSLLMAVMIFSFEFKILPIAGSNVEWSNIAQYKGSVYYQIYTDRISSDSSNVYVNYIIGDSIVSAAKKVNSFSGVSPYFGEIVSDKNGNAFIIWVDEYAEKSTVFFEKCADTSFTFTCGQLIDTLSSAANIFHTNLNIDATDDGEIVFITYNKVFFRTVSDTTVVDSTWIMFAVSEDSGSTFEQPVQLLTPDTFCIEPNISFNKNANEAYIVYTNINSMSQHIYLTTVNSPYELGDQNLYPIDTSLANFSPVINIKNDTVCVVYSSYNNSNSHMNIKMKLFDDPAIFLDSVFIAAVGRSQSYPQMVYDNRGCPLISYFDSISGEQVLMYSLWNRLSTEFESDWVLWIGNYPLLKRPEIFFMDSTHIYIDFNIQNASGAFSYLASAKPDKAPYAPENMRVNGDAVFRWYNTLPLQISWHNPYDYSAVFRAYIKFGTPPSSNNDTTLTIQDTIRNIFTLLNGETDMFVWLMDYRGNIDYHNNKVAVLKFDSILPNPPIKQSPLNNNDVMSRQFRLIYNEASDSHSGIMEYLVKIDTLMDLSTAKIYFVNDTFFNVDTSLFTEPFLDRRYYWNIFAIDSAGNEASELDFRFDLKATPPVNCILPSNKDTIDLPYDFTIHSIADYDANIRKYHYIFASDSLFSNIILDTIVGNSFSDTVFSVSELNNDSIYWRVHSINSIGYETELSDVGIFFIKDLLLDSLDINVSYLPENPEIGDTINISVYSNKANIDLDNSYIFGNNLGNLSIEFIPDSINDSSFTYELLSVGIVDTLITLCVFGESEDGFVDTLIMDINIIHPEEWFDKERVFLWPNPILGNELFISMTSLRNADIVINVYDLKGTNIIESNESILAGEHKNVSIDITNLNADMYFMLISVSDDNGEMYLMKKKFVRIK